MAESSVTVTPSPPFDPSRAYKKWYVDGKYFGDGRELAVLDYIYNREDVDQLRNNPEKVLEALDIFARSVTGLVNVGEIKGAIVVDLIRQRKPTVMVELGGYLGYSAILFGKALKGAGGTHYYSLEKNPLFAAIAASLVDLAGLRDTVRFLVGTAAEGLQRLCAELAVETPIDMMFFDHYKPGYVSDLKLCERLELVGQGTIIVADNMVIPGSPAYARWVRAGVVERREMDKLETENGNPNLLYKSRFIEAFEPTGERDGIEITECMGLEA